MTDILQLPTLRVLAVNEAADGSYEVRVESRYVPTACPYCQATRLHGHGSQQQTYRDAPTHGRTTRIVADRRRYRCQSCGKTLFDPMPDLDDKRRATRRLVEYIRRSSFHETFAAVARRVGLDEKTVRQIFGDYVEELAATATFETPRLMGIDELKIIGSYRAMITNIEQNALFDMRESRSKADLLGYFRKLPDKEKVEWVAMDMYHVYRQVVRATLPARIVVNKFHIQRMANEVLEKLRKRLRKDLPQRQRLKLKDERFLLLKRQHDLSPAAAATMLEWFRTFPLLGEAHALKEGFLSVWDHRARAAAEDAYRKWLGNLTSELAPAFKDLTTAMANWHDEVFGFFEQPITNAYTEAVNGLTRAMNRMGRGYSFEVIRARMLYEPKARKRSAEKAVDREASPQEPRMFGRMVSGGAPVKTRMAERVVEYGAHIPTLVKLLEEGYFE
jgi:transposase